MDDPRISRAARHGARQPAQLGAQGGDAGSEGAVHYRGRSLWLLWADEAELERLREMRDFPYYGTHPPRIEVEAPPPVEEMVKKR